MKITYQWLKRYVDFDWSPGELADRLTMLGLEVEASERVGQSYDGVLVAEVLERAPHPNADRLLVCRINDGQGVRRIVCGADNFSAGDRVPLVLPGYALPTREGEKSRPIKAGKIRGEVSEGMLCSGQELGLSDDGEGLLLLDADATPGQNLGDYLGTDEADTLYDLEITPNRPDWNGVLGIAREVAALANLELRCPAVELQESGSPCAGRIRIRLEDPERCPRYSARLIERVAVGPSPAWLSNLLSKLGLRSINNVVDVTNFVMMEIGQPLHAFDCRSLARNEDGTATVVVRRAHEGETFTSLDGQEHRLNGSEIMIADEQKAVALGGVMGGLNSEITPETTEVLLESACFAPGNIRATSKRLNLRTDASYRFERGVDAQTVDWASRRAAALICETTGGQLRSGAVDAWPEPPEPRRVSLRFERTDRLLGIRIPPEEQLAFLERLGLSRRSRTETAGKFAIPSHRDDLKREADLIEEVARLYGVDRIPATPPRGGTGTHAYDRQHDVLAQARSLLTGMGLHEIQGQTLVSQAAVGVSKLTQKAALENALSADMDTLRPSLLPGLLSALSYNAHHHVGSAALFEAGTVFPVRDERIVEARRLALALTGDRFAPSWTNGANPGDYDVFDLKGRLEVLLESLRIQGLQWQNAGAADSLFQEEGRLTLGKQIVGRFGQLQSDLAAQLDLKKAVLLAELDWDLILARQAAPRPFKPLPVFPAVRRDVALLVDESVNHRDILKIVRQAKPNFLQNVEIFDVFRGRGIPQGKKSLAYALVYRHPERTLTDEEVSSAHFGIVERLEKKTGARIR